MLKSKDNTNKAECVDITMKKFINLFNKKCKVYYLISSKVTQYIVVENNFYKRNILKKNFYATEWVLVSKSEVKKLLINKNLVLIPNKDFCNYEKINFLQPNLIY